MFCSNRILKKIQNQQVSDRWDAGTVINLEITACNSKLILMARLVL